MNKLSKLFIASMLALPLAACTGGDDTSDSGNVGGTANNNNTGSGDAGTGPGMTGSGDAMNDSGTAGGGGAMACAYQCEGDADCMVGGVDVGLSCLDNQCQFACTDDQGCQINPAVLVTECTTNDMCPGGACIDLGDTDYCLFPEMDATPCDTFFQVPLEVTDVDGNMVTICAQDATCGANGACVNAPIEIDCATLACPDPLTCDDASPTCSCATDADCDAAGGAYTGTCNDGVCFETCAGDDECTDLALPSDGGAYVCQ